MTKKHFIQLADHIREANARREAGRLPPMYDGAAIESLADYCWSQNRRFNRTRWIDYIAGDCGPNGGAVKATATHDENDSLY